MSASALHRKKTVETSYLLTVETSELPDSIKCVLIACNFIFLLIINHSLNKVTAVCLLQERLHVEAACFRHYWQVSFFAVWVRCRMAESAIKKFEIHLEHDIDEQYQYEPGEMLRGEVQLTTGKDIMVCSVDVQIRGEATVSWDNENSPVGQQFSARETYIDTTVKLPLTADAGGPSTGQRRPAGSGSGKSDAVPFGRGEHSLPLEIPLPSTLPSSFIGKYGSITYVLKATLREDKVLYNVVRRSRGFLILVTSLICCGDLSALIFFLFAKRLAAK